MRIEATVAAVTIAGTAILAACTAAGGPPRAAASGNRQCFRAGEVNSFWGATDRSVLVRTGVSNVYHLELAGACTDIDWANRIALRSTGGGSWICQGLDAEVIVPSPIGAQRCLVTDIRKLSPEEAKAALRR